MSACTVLVIAELCDGGVTPLTRELLGLAREIARGLRLHPDLPPSRGKESSSPSRERASDRERVIAALFACDAAVAGDLIAHGADCVYCVAPRAGDYEPEAWLPVAEQLARDSRPLAILIGHTSTGADLAPRLAFRLQAAVATGCVGVDVAAGRILYTRACYGGNARETISFAASPGIATVKAGVGTAVSDSARKGEVVRVEPKPIARRSRVVAREIETGQQRLEDAKVVVAGGRGLEGPEGFRVLENLAHALDGVVGSSRVPCDLGWCPPSWQIGLTGKTVTPDLYFAVGISGAGHHMAGCGNAKTIVAINTDPEATIFREARFGIVGDYRNVVPALAAEVARAKHQT